MGGSGGRKGGGRRAPAGGWPALRAVGRVLKQQDAILQGSRALWTANKPDGFDCPGCAWPDPKHTSSFEFCENGAKAVAWEATSKRVTAAFFRDHTLADLRTWSDHALEAAGRLTEPVAYDAGSDRYHPISWREAFGRIGNALRSLENPDQAEFYASGRASNEAAFLYQLLGRRLGTNNFPDCSNMCHEPTSVALPASIGVGKGTVTLEDFDHADLILCFGHNPGTNHPRMMGTLRSAARRGASILVFNPLRERALERFASPQDPLEVTTLASTRIASRYYQVRVGGDAAVLEGMMKALLALSDGVSAGQRGSNLDREFIEGHTCGFDRLEAYLSGLDWEIIEARAGLSKREIEEAAGIYAQSQATILCYGMGITQHKNSSSTIHQLANLLLLKGNIGRRGAGLCPLRGHSNVQGDRTVGIWEKPSEAFLAALDGVFGMSAPRRHGHTVVEAIRAMEAGRIKFLMTLGGNLAVAAPDPIRTFAALTTVDFTVHVATKLNRGHLLHGKDSLLLPCLGRTEIDTQVTGRQAVTVEDSMSMVHASRGLNPPASPKLKSEVAILAEIGRAAFGPIDPVDWRWLCADYDRIRDLIEAVLSGPFKDYNRRIRTPGGFRLPVPAADRVWLTPSGKAQFLVPDRPEGPPDLTSDTLLLTTIRSHDQYNTTIYGTDDRYRGIFGRRDVVFVNAEDLEARGLSAEDRVDIIAAIDGSGERMVRNVSVVSCDLPRGCVAAYYPETNVLVGLDEHDELSGTPAYKSAPVRLQAARP